MLSYRVDFWIHFLGNIITQIGLAYFLWRAIFDYRGVEKMGGYDFPSLMLYYLMVPLVDRMVRGPEMSYMATDIYEGSLSRYLIYPVSFFTYKYVSHLAVTVLFAAQFLLALGTFVLIFGIPEGVRFELLNFVMGFVAVLAGTLLYFYMASLLELVAFWADTVWSLLVMLRFIIYFSGGGMIPLSFFPDGVVAVLKYLPFPYLTSFSIRSFYGKVSFFAYLEGLGVMLFWTFLFFLISRILWKRGLLRYSGVGI